VCTANAKSQLGSTIVDETASILVKGKVVNERGEVLPGVIVSAKGIIKDITTDAEGLFTFQVPMNTGLVFSYLGYVTTEHTVTTDRMLTIVLKEDVRTLGETVVTTQKRRQTSIEVPVAVSALSGSNLQRLGLKQMDEMSTFIPGLQVQLQSPNNPGYVIRGVTSDGGESYSQPRISVFMDGISISRSQASVVELYDMERVEVVKGPQGTLFGRGAEIGAMHLLRNKPVNWLGGEIKLNYGTHNQRGAEGFINTPLSEKIANRFAFSYDAHDGYIKNLDGGRLNGKSSLAMRNSTRFTLGSNTFMNLVLDYQYDNYPGTSFKSNRLAPQGGDASPFTDAYLNGGKHLGIKRHTGGAAFQLDHSFSSSLKLASTTGFRAYKSNENFDADGTYLYLLDCEENVKGNQFSQEFRLNWDNGGRVSGFVGASYFYEHSRQNVQLMSNLQYTLPLVAGNGFRNTIAAQNLPATVAAGVSGGVGQFLDQIVAQHPAYAPAITPIKAGLVSQVQTAMLGAMQNLEKGWNEQMSASAWTSTPNFYGDTNQAVSQVLTAIMQNPQVAGLLQMLGMTPTQVLQQLSAGVGQSLGGLQPYSGVPMPSSYQENSTNYATNQAADIFADLTWNIVKGLSFTAGLRGTYEHQKTGYSSSSQSAPLLGKSILYQSSGGEKVWASNDYLSWVGRAALNYMFGHNNVYASISRGRRPGVISFSNDPSKIVRLQPEIIVSYEAGIKGNVLKSRLGYDFSLFYYDWSHFQSSRLVSNDNGTKQYEASDAGKAHSIGLEAGLRYSFTPNIHLFGNYAYIDGKFNKKDGDGNEQELAGNRFRLTPKSSLAIGMDVNIPINKSSMFYLRPSYSYKSKVYFENENTELLSQNGYGMLNCNLGMQWNSKSIHYEVGLFGKNMLNKKYLIDAGNSGNQIGFPTFIAGAPSVFGVSFKVGF